MLSPQLQQIFVELTTTPMSNLTAERAALRQELDVLNKAPQMNAIIETMENVINFDVTPDPQYCRCCGHKL